MDVVAMLCENAEEPDIVLSSCLRRQRFQTRSLSLSNAVARLFGLRSQKRSAQNTMPITVEVWGDLR